MKPKTSFINGIQKADTNSFWSRNKRRRKEKPFSVTGFLQDSGRKIQETMLGPGGGVGIGCGVGVGFGLVGGVGYDGLSWNHVKMVFGIGMGCGVGVGFGYGQGFGYGFDSDSLDSYLSKPNSDSYKPIIQI
ncbi:uncharacterized protein LOC132282192 [Cornus florida]|uniref:uncharacterized protein LOC132282192 n=1 Tax=Cornus florida TaxID=4283 RepID=UPI00289A7255|nr:uncharacterized protein LOC132282192 [Cornus florida]